jgi:hypothetical protein
VKVKLAARMLLVLGLAGPYLATSLTGAEAADAVRSGQWEFNTQLQAVGTAALPPGISLPPGAAAGGGMKVSHRQCIEPDKAVPSDPRRACNVDRMERKGAVITWSTTCKAPQGDVKSTGTARYSGTVMQANLNVRAPNAAGGAIETTQRITGRYLGPCTKK